MEETLSSSYISISISKMKDVKSAGWLVSFEPEVGAPTVAAFTTASAAKNFTTAVYNDHMGDERKRLPWKKRDDFCFSADCSISARGKVTFVPFP
jgi:hypothetical protein